MLEKFQNCYWTEDVKTNFSKVSYHLKKTMKKLAGVGCRATFQESGEKGNGNVHKGRPTFLRFSEIPTYPCLKTLHTILDYPSMYYICPIFLDTYTYLSKNRTFLMDVPNAKEWRSTAAGQGTYLVTNLQDIIWHAWLHSPSHVDTVN